MTDSERLAYIEKMADNLPTLRTRLSLTQEELGARIGVSRGTVIMLENKQRRMTWNTFLSLILVFSQNKDTNTLLSALDIYTDELKKNLGGADNGDY